MIELRKVHKFDYYSGEHPEKVGFFSSQKIYFNFVMMR